MENYNSHQLWQYLRPMFFFHNSDGKYYLKLEVLGGKAFLEHLFEDSNANLPAPKNNLPLPSPSAHSNPKSKFVLHVFYKSERFNSKSVECRSEPKFQDTFMLDIGYFESNKIEIMSYKL